MRLVILIQFHEALCFTTDSFNKILNGYLAGNININGMAWKTTKIFQLHFDRMIPHRNYFETICNPFLHHFILRKTNQAYIAPASYCHWGLVCFIEFLFHLHDFPAQFFMWVQDE